MKKRLSSLILILSCFVMTDLRGIEVEAKQALLYDFDTGEVLFEKNGDEIMVPSSMTKIMTAYLVFERIRDGHLKFTDTLPVTQRAWKMEGTRTFLNLNSDVSVEDLIQGLVVQSGNDACVTLAEGLSGSEEAFAEEMTRKAKDLGAQNTVFLNASGWPDEGHHTTAKDLALIAAATIRDFPEDYKKYYAQVEFTYNGIKQGNKNPLLYRNLGSGIVADGMKTGHTDAGGYGLVGSAIQNGHRLIVVINGLPKSSDRDKESTALLTWGFHEFKKYSFFHPGDVVDEVDVWGGAEPKVSVVAGGQVQLVLPRTATKDMVVKAIYNSPLSAPLKSGDRVGTIEIAIPGKPTQEIPLLAGRDVEKAGFFNRISMAVSYLLWGKYSS